MCRSCGVVQKIADSEFERECSEIYSSYAVYHQGQGEEQQVFEQSGGMPLSRSEFLLKQVLQRIHLPETGRLLDIGCGNGNLLKSFVRMCPYWKLNGSELDDKYQKEIEEIQNMEAFYVCGIEEITGNFDMITMLHTLEHIIDPISFLKKLRLKLKPDGILLIEVPDYRQNPFDLVIADHCSHFDLKNLTMLLNASGFDIIVADSFVPKELSVVARKRDTHIDFSMCRNEIFSTQNVQNTLNWLKKVIDEATKIADDEGEFGIFGTSIAGTWLCNELGDAVTFFVDEDYNRVGKKFMRCEIYHPQNVPMDWRVFIPFPFSIATQILKRMQIYPAEFHIPAE